MSSSIIRELLKLTEKPDMISFAGGLPAPEVFPYAEVEAATKAVSRDHARVALQYGTTEGFTPLRELIVRLMGDYGIRVGLGNVLVTSGSQQGLDLIGKLLINAGDRVLTECPTYVGAVQAWNAYQAEYITVPADDDGLCVDEIEDALRAGPKFLYVLPNFQNPGGTTLSLPRRRRLVEIANHYGVPIVEDDPYGQLRFEGERLPSIAELDAEYHGCARSESAFTGNVIYLSTFSKTLAPGLRIAWVVAEETVIQKLVQIKQGTDLHTGTFAQVLTWELARNGFLERHLTTIRAVYGERRRTMLGAMETHFPPGVRWTRPEGGLFLWVTLPAGADSMELFRRALEEKVAFVPGSAFFPNGGGKECFRLNFSYATPDRIEEGIARLGRAMRKQLGIA
jgi:2-aminoadipate transaminase